MVAVTVFAVLVPSAMAFGELAGVNPVAGLYVALGAMLMYALFGTSKQVIMGPEATSAILTATAVAPLAGGDPARYAALAAATAILVGVVAILARIAKLGFITDFLSKPILVGYIFGAALIVIGSQLGKMFGIKLESDLFFQQVLELLRRLDEAHLLTVLLGVVFMAALIICAGSAAPCPARSSSWSRPSSSLWCSIWRQRGRRRRPGAGRTAEADDPAGEFPGPPGTPACRHCPDDPDLRR